MNARSELAALLGDTCFFVSVFERKFYFISLIEYRGRAFATAELVLGAKATPNSCLLYTSDAADE